MTQIHTQHTYTSIDHGKTEPRPQPSEEVARAYAVEMTNRVQGETHVLSNGKPIAKYIDGVEA